MKANLYATPQRNQNQEISSQTLQDHRQWQSLAPRCRQAPFASKQKSKTSPVFAQGDACWTNGCLSHHTKLAIQPLDHLRPCMTATRRYGMIGPSCPSR